MSMTKNEIRQLAEALAPLVAERLQKSSNQEMPTEAYVSCKEAARILKISPLRLRVIKDRLPHVKVGNNSQGRLLFLRKGLEENYVNG